jgi:hypothetical protein
MKNTITSAIWLLLLPALTVWFVGCTQTIVQKPDGTRLKINTLLMTSGLESLYYDPNGFFEVGKYKGIPSDVELEYDPLTNSFKAKASK